MSKPRTTKRCSGFSLAETLLATLILTFVAVLLATGVPFAKMAYAKIVNGANARMLLSNTVTALRNELGTAMDIEVNTDYNTIVYYSTDIHSKSMIYLYGTTGTPPIPEAQTQPPVGAIMIQQYITVEADKRPLPRRLVSSSASNGNLYVKFDGLEFVQDSETRKITALKIKGFKVLDAANQSESPYVLVDLNEMVIHPVVGPLLKTTARPEAESVTEPEAGT